MKDLEIIYEDKDIIAINKPAGVVYDWALQMRKDLYVVHRLDKDTSGIILFAKNRQATEYLKKLFQEHAIQKTYRVLVVGRMKQKRGVIDLPIGRSVKTPLKRVAIGEQRGTIRFAFTEYKVLKTNDNFSYVEVYPKTGRTHQIRSHFVAIGHPVVCDRLYAGKRYMCPGGLSRHFLHAARLEFTLPSGGRIVLEAELPDDLRDILDRVL